MLSVRSFHFCPLQLTSASVTGVYCVMFERFAYLSHLSRLLLGCRIWIELKCSSARSFGLMKHRILGLLRGDSAVWIAGGRECALLLQL